MREWLKNEAILFMSERRCTCAVREWLKNEAILFMSERSCTCAVIALARIMRVSARVSAITQVIAVTTLATSGPAMAEKSSWTPGQYTDYSLSSRAMTVGVTTKDGKIIEGPPIVRKFIGQPLVNLIGWMTKHGDLRVECGPEYTPERRQLKK